MRYGGVVVAISAFLCGASPAGATVAVAIDLTHQTMHVQAAGGTYDWPISSARSGFYTPGGSFAPTRLEAMHYSHKYHMSPMPHAIFFRGGYAIHGTYATGALGRPASHGCVRLAPGNAARLYAMVQAEGARISISGSPPQGASRIATAVRRRAPARGSDDAGFRPGVGYDWDAAPVARVARRAPRDDAYLLEGYRYVGRRDGHRIYQALPTYATPFGGASLY